MTKKVAFISASVSRNAGGLFVSVRKLAQSVYQNESYKVDVFGIIDSCSESDKAKWLPIIPELYHSLGPKAYGYAPSLVSALCKKDIDLIHAQGLWMYTSKAVETWSKGCNSPYIVSPRGMLDSWALQNAKWKKRLVGMLYEKSYLKNASCIHALTESEAKAMRSYGLMNPICVVPNGIDIPEKRISDRQLMVDGMPENSNVMLYLGRLHPKKGLLNLLHAWSCVWKSFDQIGRSWQLVIAGWDQGGHENELKKFSRELGIDRSVTFLGPQFGKEKHYTYLRSNAFILPSFSEGLPMTVLEAWSYGLPVLMTPQCNLPEGFQENAAIHIDASVDDIVKGLQCFMEQTEQEQKDMGCRGLNLVKRKFSWEKIASEMCDVYEWVLGGGEKPDSVIMGGL